MEQIKEISTIVKNINNNEEIENFFKELLTESELETLSKRWRILNMLKEGFTQREISKELSVSLCKVTRGSKIIKNKDSIITKYLIKEKI